MSTAGGIWRDPQWQEKWGERRGVSGWGKKTEIEAETDATAQK